MIRRDIKPENIIMKRHLISLTILCGLAVAPSAFAEPVDAASPALVVDAGPGVVAADATPAPSATALPNPVDDPGAAIDSLRAARKLGWAAAILAAIVMLAAGLARAADKWPTLPGLSWFARHRTSIFIAAAVSTIGAASYNAIALGGTWLAAGAAAVAALLTLIAPTPKQPEASESA